jgi:hypothetical protein
MTTTSMHSASAPALAKILGNMIQWLEAAKAYAETKKFDTGVYTHLRLAPDMFALPRQIQIATDTAKGCVARLAGQDAPKFEDNETTLDELIARLAKTRDYVLSVPASAIDGSEDREILIPRRSGEPLRFTGHAYLQHFALPNFYFHATTTYALLRQAGVPIGKTDFLGG